MTRRKQLRVGDRIGEVVSLGGSRWRCPCGSSFTADTAKVRAWARTSRASCPRCYYAARVEELVGALADDAVDEVESVLVWICRLGQAELGPGLTLAERAAVIPDLPHAVRRAAVVVLSLAANGGAQ